MSTPKSINNVADERVNARSPYYILGDRAAPTAVTVPDPSPGSPPTVTIVASNENPSKGESVTLTAVATDSDGTVVAYNWGGFGTGSTRVITVSAPTLIQSAIYLVTVTDNDGLTASDTITINWQDDIEILEEPDMNVNCGETISEGAFVQPRIYTLNVGDKIGNVTIELQQPPIGSFDAPVSFLLDWNGTTATTGYVGSSEFGGSLITDGSQFANNTASTTNKTVGTSVSVNKTAATPNTATLTIIPGKANINPATTPVMEFPIINDNLSFKLTCPNVVGVPTVFITLKGTCGAGQTSTITYVDVDGVTQTVTLNNDEIKVVSGRPGSVSQTVCTTDVTEGGDSFDKGQPEQNVASDTQFVFWHDRSGSLDNENVRITSMTENQLKDSFLKFYNNDDQLYQNRVIHINDRFDPIVGNVLTDPANNIPLQTLLGITSGTASHALIKSERFLAWLSAPLGSPGVNGIELLKETINVPFIDKNGDAIPAATKIIHIVFIDEANTVYHDTNGTLTDQSSDNAFSTDITALRATLAAQSNYGDHLGIVFCISGFGYSGSRKFHDVFIPNLISGTVSGMSGSDGIADHANEIKFVVGTTVANTIFYGNSADFYHSKVITELQNLGFNI